jgi:hypothetical protein
MSWFSTNWDVNNWFVGDWFLPGESSGISGSGSVGFGFTTEGTGEVISGLPFFYVLEEIGKEKKSLIGTGAVEFKQEFNASGTTKTQISCKKCKVGMRFRVTVKGNISREVEELLLISMLEECYSE